MFIIDLNYTAPLKEIDQYMDPHVQYLEKYYDNGIFVVWGRKQPRTGGIILALAATKEEVEKIIIEDPFHIHGLAEISITEFLVSKHRPDLQGLLG